MDVLHYKLDLMVNPYKETISGEVLIRFKLMKDVDNLEIDLINKFSISGTVLNGMSMSFKHRDNKVLIDNPGVPLFKSNELLIKYGGKPPKAKNPPWDGGVTWSLDNSGRHWVGVSCQSVGAHTWFPCKEHPSDKAEGAEIYISVEMARINSKEFNVSLDNELSRLIIHGVLHLIGFNDDTEDSKKIMFLKQEEIISNFSGNVCSE